MDGTSGKQILDSLGNEFITAEAVKAGAYFGFAKQKNAIEPKDVVKNWLRSKNTLEYLGLWEQLNNPNFKGVEFDPLLREAGSNAFTMSPTRWVELTNAVGIICKSGANGGTYAQRDIAFKFASWVSVEFELYLIKEFQRLKEIAAAFLFSMCSCCEVKKEPVKVIQTDSFSDAYTIINTRKILLFLL